MEKEMININANLVKDPITTIFFLEMAKKQKQLILLQRKDTEKVKSILTVQFMVTKQMQQKTL